MTHAELEQRPDLQALVDAANLLCVGGAWDQAVPKLQHLLTTGYTPSLVQQAMGTCLMNLGHPRDAIARYQEALRLDPTLRSSQENLIFLLDAQPETTDALAQATRAQWWDRFGAAAYAKRLPFKTRPDPDKRIRVAYVSADFRFHSAAMAVSPVLTGHSAAVEPVLYSTLPVPLYDYVTKMWQARYGYAFVDASTWSPEILAEVLREDEIDIAVDLSGWTAGNSLLAFAYKPAPVQLTGWGYATGTGMPAMDGLLADPVVAPLETRHQLAERVVELPCVMTYEPREHLPEPGPLPCLETPPVFAVFQRAMKLNPETLETWRQILLRVPTATLLFKGPDYTPSVRQWIHEHMRGVEQQLEFAYFSMHREHMHWYLPVNLSLDTWPQTGGVSSFESLWMGVPVVTLLGPRVMQRTTASILTVLGLQQGFVAETREDYIEKAVEWVTTGRVRLQAVRQGLRPLLQASPIMTGYVDAVETQYRSLWRDWCASQERAA